MIGVIDLGRGNIGSVFNALKFLGESPCVLDSPRRINDCKKIILPGVGSFFSSMTELKSRNFSEALRGFAAHGGKILGICLGMQLLASLGTENGEIEGLNLIPGKVRRMSPPDGFRVPHVGWNGVNRKQRHPIFQGVKEGVDFYFTHSFIFEVDDPSHAVGSTNYGEAFTSVVVSGNVWGVQFHPEKSQKNGLRILKNFLEEGTAEC